jgi:hypothetical protein
MVAQANSEIWVEVWLSPTPEPSDCDDVVVALRAARALEMQGDAYEAARWLRRAVEAAGTAGDDARVLALANAAADLTSTLQRKPTAAPPPPPELPSARSYAPPKSSVRALIPPPVPTAPRLTQAPASASSKSGPRVERSKSSDPPRSVERRTLRVCFRPAAVSADRIILRRLAVGEPVPPGAIAATLALDDGETNPFREPPER